MSAHWGRPEVIGLGVWLVLCFLATQHDEWIPTCADCGSSRKRAAPMFADHVWQRLAEPHE
jgi:hypothetical protein